MSKLPIKISPCPIIETNIEIRFVPNFPPDAVIGIIYNLLSSKDRCSLIQRPIMQLPAEVRTNDPQLKYQPTHTIQTPHSLVHVGPYVTVIQIPNVDYPGWKEFRKIIDNIISLLRKIRLIQRVDFIGLKYLNFFKFDIFNQVNLSIEGLPKMGNSTVFRTELENDKFTNVLQISNGVHVKNPRFESDGSLIDITTIVLARHGLTLDNIMTHIDEARKGEKELFFSLLKQEYLNTLSPEYE